MKAGKLWQNYFKANDLQKVIEEIKLHVNKF